LEFRSLGTNIFLAEFANQFDRDRVLGGSPWHISKHGVLLKFFDPLVKPSDVIFDRLSLWARIFKLPFGLMNDTRGKELAGNLGKVEAMDVDSKGRAWGDFLRVRVAINVLEPVMRCVSVFSQKRKTKEIFQVMYERLPIYCFSCGLIGHSSLGCPTPGERTADGLLPYHGSLVCVPEDKKKKGSGAQFGQSPYANNRSEPGSGQCGHNPVHASQQGADGFGESVSPTKPMKPRAKRTQSVKPADTINRVNSGKALVVANGSAGQVSGQKRKIYRPKVLPVINDRVTSELPLVPMGALVDVPVQDAMKDGGSTFAVVSNKKLKTASPSIDRSADQAAAVNQPCQTR
jgi:hypothetical protein